jgi:hypothetical protein
MKKRVQARLVLLRETVRALEDPRQVTGGADGPDAVRPPTSFATKANCPPPTLGV